MGQQQVAHTPSASWAKNNAETSTLSAQQQKSLKRLNRAFREAQELIFLNDTPNAHRVTSQFVSNLDSDVTVIRMSGPFADDLSVMRKIIQGVGFESTDLCLNDLENVLSMFLSFQQSHQYRTVLMFQNTDNCGTWLLERIRHIVQCEVDHQYGLMTIVCGHCTQTVNAETDKLESAAATPFSLAETRVFVRSQLESSGTSDIAQVFEFDAITLIHELSEGIEETVTSLYAESLKLASETNTRPIRAGMVRAVFERLYHPAEQAPPRRITVRADGQSTRHLPLDRGHILIGRDQLCDIRVSSRAVSRHHALVVNSIDGITIIDLGSTNGTFVDGQQVAQFELKNSGVITIGDCNMEYAAGDNQDPWEFDLGTEDKETVAKSHQSTQTLKCDIKGNINAKGEKIYHVIGMASYEQTQIDKSKGERWFTSEEEAIAAGWRKSRR